MSQRNNTTSLGRETANAGLPEADDYNPAALDTVEFRSGEVTQDFSQFGIQLVPIEYTSATVDGWQDTGRRIVSRNGRNLTVVSDRYKLLPNERAVEAANEAAQRLGAKPFHEWERPEGEADSTFSDNGWYIELDDHVFQDPDRRRVHALYAWDSSLFEGERLDYGFAVHNSIDGSQAFKVGLFSYRHACQNMVLMGLSSMPLRVEGERQILTESSHRHTTSLGVSVDSLADRIEETVTFVDQIDDAYRTWQEEVLDTEQVIRLMQNTSLPTSDLPDWIEEAEDFLGTKVEEHNEETADEEDEADDWTDLPDDMVASVVEAHHPNSESTWETYNSITESIWHSTTKDTTKQRKFNALHGAVTPAIDG
jgi:hypothetical protein